MISFLQSEPKLDDHIVIKRSKRARRLALRLDPQERVFHLVVPERTSMRAAERFAVENEQWMQEQLQDLPTPIPLLNGMVIPILGEDHLIKIDYDDGLKRTRIELKDSELRVFTNKDDPANRIQRFLRKLAKEQITPLAHEKAAQIEKKIDRIQVRDTKSRWGSCSEDGRLSFSWRLIFAPYEAFDYVVAHEVAHLVHLDHSKDFWALCCDLSEDYIEGKRWMRKHSGELMRYC